MSPVCQSEWIILVFCRVGVFGKTVSKYRDNMLKRQSKQASSIQIFLGKYYEGAEILLKLVSF
jgi:hypothetical protein